MPTRLKRPSILRQLAFTGALVAFQAYLGYSALSGQFGIEGRHQLLQDVTVLEAEHAAVMAEIDAYRHRISLFDPDRLDPDVLTEKARSLLAMAHPDDVVIVPGREGRNVYSVDSLNQLLLD